MQWRRVLSGVAAGAFSLAVLTSLTACGGTTSSARALAGSRPKDVVVARVNGKPIRWQDVARRIQMLKLAAPAQASHLGGEALADEVRTELIDEALVVDAARRAHLSVGAKEVAADTARLMREFVPGLYPTRAAFRAALHRLGLTEGDLRAYVAQSDLVALYLDRTVHPTPVTEAAVAEWYRSHEAELRGPTEYHVRQILVPSRSLAEAVERELRRGRSFGDLVRRYSQDRQSRAHGGDLGWAPLSAYVPSFAQAVSRLRVGQVSGIVESPYGYHIIELLGIRPGSLPALATVAPQIRSYLEGQAQQRAIASLVAKLRAKAKVQIYPMPKA